MRYQKTVPAVGFILSIVVSCSGQVDNISPGLENEKREVVEEEDSREEGDRYRHLPELPLVYILGGKALSGGDGPQAEDKAYEDHQGTQH